MLEHPPVGRCDWVSAVSDSLYCTAIFTPVTLLSITARALVSRKDDILQSSLHFSMEENFFTCLQILHSVQKIIDNLDDWLTFITD